jgi:hypothetical protein
MRQLIVTVTTPEGEVIDRETVEVEHDALAIALVPLLAGETTPETISTLNITGLGATEL